MSDNYLLGDLVADLYACASLNERFKMYEKCIQKLDFEAASYTFIPKIVTETQLNTPPVFVRSALFPESFIEQYVTDRFDKNDFTIRAIQNNVLCPMDWQDCFQSDSLTDAEKNVLFLAKQEHNIQNGISLPMMNDSVGIAGFSIVSSMQDVDFTRVKQQNLNTLQLCTKAFHDIVFSRVYAYHEFIPSVLLDLSDKEKIVLEYISKGKTMEELGKSNAPVSKRYGEKILLELRQKFGDISTHELIHHISQLKLI
ncbi:helix-turn-helix transcriptional regulator [Candidatus Thiothrix anitrata]|uniref:Autoinducer binding domain-containing protein n=1 Tax=Candidatus Thiothrix anitrata TaxID=2823902 RepID=A0ABX7X426_9GAMM|nr:autoinducer binding domain-containing protein [Candidatus Thiothrix anitrata]QTR49448.1 autoinducer binding domain-containing protein [Candidatus Thiothrix anitrata]